MNSEKRGIKGTFTSFDATVLGWTVLLLVGMFGLFLSNTPGGEFAMAIYTALPAAAAGIWWCTWKTANIFVKIVKALIIPGVILSLSYQGGAIIFGMDKVITDSQRTTLAILTLVFMLVCAAIPSVILGLDNMSPRTNGFLDGVGVTVAILIIMGVISIPVIHLDLFGAGTIEAARRAGLQALVKNAHDWPFWPIFIGVGLTGWAVMQFSQRSQRKEFAKEAAESDD